MLAVLQFVSTVITAMLLMAARPMVITDRAISTTASSSAWVHGLAGVMATAGALTALAVMAEDAITVASAVQATDAAVMAEAVVTLAAELMVTVVATHTAEAAVTLMLVVVVLAAAVDTTLEVEVIPVVEDMLLVEADMVVVDTGRLVVANGGAYQLRRFAAFASRSAWYSVGVNLRSVSSLCVLSVLWLSGCSSRLAATHEAHVQQRAVIETQREQLDRIPPPAKSTFMAVHSFESWQNPVLTVQPSMLELQVTMADGNTTSIGVGGMFRPIGARRQELNISMDTLGDAISAVPPSSWPYGRVVAIEEANKTPRSAEPAVRRNMEVTINRLNDLGIIVYDLSSGKVD